MPGLVLRTAMQVPSQEVETRSNTCPATAMPPGVRVSPGWGPPTGLQSPPLDRRSAGHPALWPSPREHQRILALAQDLPNLWHSATTTNVERKQLLGYLVKD